MDAPVTPVTSGKPRSRIRVQNFVAVEGLSERAWVKARRGEAVADHGINHSGTPILRVRANLYSTT